MALNETLLYETLVPTGHRSSRILFVLCPLALISACGPRSSDPSIAEKVRPKAKTAREALDEPIDPQCHDVGTFGQPLVVDWRAHERANIELAMHDGIAVVAYSCNDLRLLHGCHFEGDYGFVGVSKKEEVVRFEDADELAANLPSLGIPMLTKIDGELKRGSTLDLAMMLVGKRRTTIGQLDRNKLRGGDACKGATHFVRGAFVGAFAMGTGTRGAASLGVGLFSTASQSTMVGKYRDGKPEACEQAKDSDETPAESCKAILRLELVGLNSPAVSLPTQCPVGLVLAGGKCTPPTVKTAHVCKMGDLGDCSTQCDRGNVVSCSFLGRMYLKGEGTPVNLDRALPLLVDACEKGDALGCASLGLAYDEGKGVPVDAGRAVTLYEKSCAGGEPIGCSNLGTMYLDGTGVGQDSARAAELFLRACNGGNAIACSNVAGMYYEGRRDFAKNLGDALTYYKRACDGARYDSCFNAGLVIDEGGQPDKPLAYSYYRKACEGEVGEGCANAGFMRAKGDGISKSESDALVYFQRGCSFKERTSCSQLHQRGFIYHPGHLGQGSTNDMPKD